MDGGPLPSRRLAAGGRAGSVLVIAAGLLGAAGVGLAAASAHHGGGDITAIGATFALLHAAAILALTGVAAVRPGLAAGLLVAAGAMTFGTALFSGDLALAGLADWRPWPQAAPIGGTVLIAAWLAVGVTGIAGAIRGR